MVIQEYYPRPIPRNTIVFFEEEPSTKAKAGLKRFTLRKINESELEDPKKFQNVAAVIFRQDVNNPNYITRVLEKYADIILCQGCRVFVEIAYVKPGSQTPSFRHLVLKAIEKLPASGLQDDEYEQYSWSKNERLLTPKVHVVDGPDIWGEISTYLQDYPPSPPPSLSLTIEAVDDNNASISLDNEQKILLKRAFHDCQNVKLVKNLQGRSCIDTYRVFAFIPSESIRLSPPYQYFAKIGKREKISKEYLAYREMALEHIPFHLGPRLRLDRCALGAQQGIIVSDYVSGTENLRDCAQNGRAVPVIAGLFDTTLRSWHDGSKREGDKSLQDYIKDRMQDTIPPFRVSRIKEFGALKNPPELKSLVAKIPSKPVQVGVVHGDLHALNVLVRGGDAIVIDFEKVEKHFPLLLDLASLEAGLFVDGFINDRRSGQELLKSINCLYEAAAFDERRFKPCDPSNGSVWYFDCVRQIRMQAWQIERARGQYALTLAVELAKKGCKDKDFNSPEKSAEQNLSAEDVRALAYVLAEQILVELDQP